MSDQKQPEKKRLTKAEKKKAKEAAKAAKKAATAARIAKEQGRNAPVLKRFTDGDFGDLTVINSSYKTNRVWTEVPQLSSSIEGEAIWLRARVHSVRATAKVTFLVLRRGMSTCQCVAADGPVGRDLVKYAGKLPPESVIDVFGKVTTPKNPIQSVTQSDVEIQIEKIYGVSISAPRLPFQLEDASKPDSDERDENGLKVPSVSQKVRLDYRWVDLRTQANHAIFRIQSAVCQYFREYFISLGFIEMHTPKIMPGVSEGGSEVFTTKYFGKDCCLAQSPQLYKQMAVVSDLFKVFEIGPVFRAENSNTHRHMCEFTGLDFEMEIKEHYHEVLRVLGNLFVHIFDRLNQYHKAELAAINKQYPFEPLKYKPKDETLVIDFPAGVKMLNEDGFKMGPYDDLSTPGEKRLGALIKKKHDVDFYICDFYPLDVRPFYTMPSPLNPKYTNSYDVFVRGEEITSGAQRIHEVELLKKRAIAKEIPLESLKKYIESFSYGAMPHGGAGIGMERVVMLFLGLDNIRKSSLFPRTPNRVEP
jgi:nondiscriminating aspartyl-tRNA synthetase